MRSISTPLEPIHAPTSSQAMSLEEPPHEVKEVNLWGVSTSVGKKSKKKKGKISEPEPAAVDEPATF